MPFQAQPTEKCSACGKTVYLTEKAVVEEKTDKKVYHKQCIRCTTCNKVLTTGQYSSMDGQFWCKPHFKQLFATKGNYDEAFGKEKATSKWEPSTNAAPASFIPESSSEVQKEKKPTSEATMAKFRQFRTEGDSDKCSSCAKTVYHAEKLLVEDKNEKRTFHKACFKCSVCNMVLDLRSYGSTEGKIFCKNHLKEQLDRQSAAARSNTGPVSTPTSFIPSNQEEKKQEKGQTPENIASKFKGAETEKCKACNKSVYATEKVILPESFKQQSIYHKACLKCSVCSAKLDVSTYGSANGVLFCHPHLKQFGKPEQAKGDYFISPLANTNTDYSAGPKDDGSARVDSDEERQPVDRDSEREDTRMDDRPEEEQRERASSTGSNGRTSDADRSGDAESDTQQLESRLEKADISEPEPEPERVQEEAPRRDNSDDERRNKESERQRKREERQRQVEEEQRQEEEEREKRRRERERRAAESETLTEGESSSREEGSSREADRDRRRREREEERRREEEERERQEEKRRREREARRKEQEEETKRELEEQERKAEERRRKLAELKGDN